LVADYAKIDLSRTICAIATPIGRSGLGIVRLSGPDAIAIADRIFRPQQGSHLVDHHGFTVHYGHIIDPKCNEPVDEVLAILFRNPKSFTGEDLVEFSAHGAPIVLHRIVAILAEHGAEMALPGEFTLRAFLNGRIDLTEAEAVADIIGAKTEGAATAALEQLQGALHEEIVALRVELIAALARLEIGIDFTEEDLEPTELVPVDRRLRAVAARIDHLLAGYNRGRVLRDGFVVVLAGPPNVGKSTLFNRLAQDERAIVTEIPGTTRDILREYINLDGWPVCLVDTAGIHDATDLIEKIGVERSADAIRSADAAIWLIDANVEWLPQRPPDSFHDLPVPWLIAVNKLDLVTDPDAAVYEIAAHHAPIFPRIPAVAGISAKTGAGVEDLVTAIKDWINESGIDAQSARIAINDRHRAALRRAQQSIAQAIQSLTAGRSLELIAFDTKSAAVALGEIIGETTTADVLSEIFSSFCIGK